MLAQSKKIAKKKNVPCTSGHFGLWELLAMFYLTYQSVSMSSAVETMSRYFVSALFSLLNFIFVRYILILLRGLQTSSKACYLRLNCVTNCYDSAKF